ncbi:MAG: hypothetical protein EVA65_16035 [Oceanococcus sp.]|nr:MAG: hypothetical protein EVA65_16035 [Oceanococcus sp.]
MNRLFSDSDVNRILAAAGLKDSETVRLRVVEILADASRRIDGLADWLDVIESTEDPGLSVSPVRLNSRRLRESSAVIIRNDWVVKRQISERRSEIVADLQPNEIQIAIGDERFDFVKLRAAVNKAKRGIVDEDGKLLPHATEEQKRKLAFSYQLGLAEEELAQSRPYKAAKSRALCEQLSKAAGRISRINGAVADKTRLPEWMPDFRWLREMCLSRLILWGAPTTFDPVPADTARRWVSVYRDAIEDPSSDNPANQASWPNAIATHVYMRDIPHAAMDYVACLAHLEYIAELGEAEGIKQLGLPTIGNAALKSQQSSLAARSRYRDKDSDRAAAIAKEYLSEKIDRSEAIAAIKKCGYAGASRQLDRLVAKLAPE